MNQFKFETEPAATDKAKELSKEGEKFAAIVLSNGTYYVEDSTPFIRNHEKLIAQYENGKKLKS